MRKHNKKGFTIIELVIVVGVIGVLSAILIPTFVNLTNKANESADIQSCRQMNEYLAIHEISGDKTILDVYAALSEGGMSAKDYKPLTSDTFYFWDKTLNRVVYTDGDYNVKFPAEYSSATKANGWYSLSGTIKETPVTISEGKVTVSTAEELSYVVNQATTTNVSEITLSQDIDLMGAYIGFSKLATIDGDGHTIKGANNLKAATTHETSTGGTHKYCAAMIPVVDAATYGSNAVITIKDLTIKDAAFGDTKVGNVGLLIGDVELNAHATINIENVTIQDCVISGQAKTGSLIGFLRGGTVNITNTVVNNVAINTAEAEGGKLIGATQNNCVVNITDYKANPTADEKTQREAGTLAYSAFENITLGLTPLDKEWPVVEVASDTNVTFGTGVTAVTYGLKSGNKLVAEIEDDYSAGTKYRIYSPNAWMSAHVGTCNGLIITVNGSSHNPFSGANTTAATYGDYIIKASCLPVNSLVE